MATKHNLVAILQSHLAEAVQLLGGKSELSRATGLSHEAVEVLEGGSIDGWTTSMAEALALALGRDPAAIWEPETRPMTLSFLRGTRQDFNADDLNVFIRALERGASLRALREILDLPPSRRKSFRQAEVSTPPYRQGYEMAIHVRNTLGWGEEPLPNLHQQLPNLLDIPVVHARLHTSGLVAAAVSQADGDAIIINDAVEDDLVLNRRSIAHELCHLLFDQRPPGLFAVLEGDADDEPYEQRARAFAAELLVPESALISLLGVPERTRDLETAVELAKRTALHFSAPATLAANHLRNHGFIHDKVREATKAGLNGFRPKHPERRTNVLQLRIDQAVSEDRITSGRAAELRSAS